MKSKFFLFVLFCSLMTSLIEMTAIQAEEQKFVGSSQREKDLTVIINQTYFKEDVFEKLGVIFAAQALAKSNKCLPMEDLLFRLRLALETAEVRRQLMEPFSPFSDEEIHQLRQIYENETYLKYMGESFAIGKTNMEVMTKVIESIIEQYDKIPKPSNSDEKSTIVKLTSDNFPQVVEQATQPVIIDVYANWCTPCQAFAPTFEAVSRMNQTNCKFAKLDFTCNSELANRWNVVGLPTILFMYKGQVILRSEGFITKEEFEVKIQDFLKKIQTN